MILGPVAALSTRSMFYCKKRLKGFIILYRKLAIFMSRDVTNMRPFLKLSAGREGRTFRFFIIQATKISAFCPVAPLTLQNDFPSVPIPRVVQKEPDGSGVPVFCEIVLRANLRLPFCTVSTLTPRSRLRQRFLLIFHGGTRPRSISTM